VCECKLSAPTEPKGANSHECNVFVGGLLQTTTQESLQAQMEAYGPVTHAKIILDKETGKSKGFGFVEFAQSASAVRAVRTGFVLVDGKNCNCRMGGRSIGENAGGGFGGMGVGMMGMGMPMMGMGMPRPAYKDMNDPLTYAKEQLLTAVNSATSLHALFTSTRGVLDQLHTYYYNQQQSGLDASANMPGKRPGMGPMDAGGLANKRPKFEAGYGAGGSFGGGAGGGHFNNTAPNWNTQNYY